MWLRGPPLFWRHLLARAFWSRLFRFLPLVAFDGALSHCFRCSRMLAFLLLVGSQGRHFWHHEHCQSGLPASWLAGNAGTTGDRLRIVWNLSRGTCLWFLAMCMSRFFVKDRVVFAEINLWQTSQIQWSGFALLAPVLALLCEGSGCSGVLVGAAAVAFRVRVAVLVLRALPPRLHAPAGVLVMLLVILLRWSLFVVRVCPPSVEERASQGAPPAFATWHPLFCLFSLLVTDISQQGLVVAVLEP